MNFIEAVNSAKFQGAYEFYLNNPKTEARPGAPATIVKYYHGVWLINGREVTDIPVWLVLLDNWSVNIIAKGNKST